ncbi:MAG: D-2-hydroxyacid dehydrogenase [Symbiobacteriaceae bacterium]|nr:D-2-hydroxyacid dehydrogenase [Symbiobacteriaceae bacterium]
MRIVITSELAPDLVAELQNKHPELQLVFTTERELSQHLSEAEVLFVRRLTVEQLQQAPLLKMVQIPYAGMDQLPLAALQERGVLLANARIHGETISELTLGMMIALTRSFAEIHRNQQQHKWLRVPQQLLMGSTLALLGVGTIGGEIAKRAKCFGMKTLGFTLSGSSHPYIDESYSSNQLILQVSRADFLVAACPLTQETHHLINQTILQAMKPSAYILNIGRGPVIDEAALIAALQAQVIAGAALDVFEKEPLPVESPLWDMPNVLVFPHLAGNLEGNSRRAAQIFVENVSNLLAGSPLTCAVDLSKGY